VFGFEAGCQRYLSSVSNLQGSFPHGTAMTQKRGASHTFRVSNDLCKAILTYESCRNLKNLKSSTAQPWNLWSHLSPQVSCRYTWASVHLDKSIYILPRGPCLLLVRSNSRRGSRGPLTLEGVRCHGFPMTLKIGRWWMDLNASTAPTGVLLRHPIGRLKRNRSSASDT